MRPPLASSSSSSIAAAAATAPSSSSAPPATTRRALLLSTSALTLAAVVPAVAQAAANPFSTPYSQSRTLQLGLDTNGLVGKIRTCPSTNPGCVCTNPTVGASSSVASPLIIPESTSADAAAQMLRQAILKTQKNVSFNVDQQTPHDDLAQE
uniref:Uncharacterized protein n=1 Tax=Aegilops tauschii subsp. strangulata TaxID=200361 RepID=A0A453E0L7_AEGTS